MKKLEKKPAIIVLTVLYCTVLLLYVVLPIVFSNVPPVSIDGEEVFSYSEFFQSLGFLLFWVNIWLLTPIIVSVYYYTNY